MARHARVQVGDLASGLVLAPERYDPRRDPVVADSVPLSQLATLSRESVRAATSRPEMRYRVFDTSDAREGFLAHGRPTVDGVELGSSKRVLHPGDVLISRLRPYLRQVAWVDSELDRQGVVLCASAEFFVLRPAEGQSLAFLVPWLLSAPIQEVLAASQEGGHHPRFDRATLLGLPVAADVVSRRAATSQEVSQAIASLREGRQWLAELCSSQ